jgi:hypothetical protein
VVFLDCLIRIRKRFPQMQLANAPADYCKRQNYRSIIIICFRCRAGALAALPRCQCKHLKGHMKMPASASIASMRARFSSIVSSGPDKEEGGSHVTQP